MKLGAEAAQRITRELRERAEEAARLRSTLGAVRVAALRLGVDPEKLMDEARRVLAGEKRR